MNLQNYAICDETVMGSPKVINGLTLIPILDIIFGGYTKSGLGFGCSISPKAFIIIDSTGKVSFYNLSIDVISSDLLESITFIDAKE